MTRRVGGFSTILRAEMLLVRRNILRVLLPVLFITFLQSAAVSRAVEAYLSIAGVEQEFMASLVDTLLGLSLSYLVIIVSILTAMALTGLVSEQRLYGIAEHVYSSGHDVETIIYSRVLCYVSASLCIGLVSVTIYSAFLLFVLDYMSLRYILYAAALCTVLIVPVTALYYFANSLLPRSFSILLDLVVVLSLMTLPSLIMYKESLGVDFMEALFSLKLSPKILLALALLLWLLIPVIIKRFEGKIVEKSVLPP